MFSHNNTNDAIYYAAYARVSTDEQRNGNSIDLQVDKIQQWVDNQTNFVCIGEFIEDFTGFEYERPEMDIIRDLAKQGKINAVIVAKSDRFARDEAVFLTLERFFKRYNVRLFSVDEGEFTPGTINRYLAAIQRAKAQDDAETNKKRMRDARHGYMDKGIPPAAGKALYGYTKTGRKSETQYVILEHEAKIVLRIFALYIARYSFDAIADILNEQGIPQPTVSKGSKHMHPQNGWTRWSVRYIVYNADMYHGIMTGYKRAITRDTEETVIINIPAIIDDNTYTRIMFLRQQNRSVFRNSHDWAYLLAGRISCKCGYSVAKDTIKKHSGDGYYYYYRCACAQLKKYRGDCPVNRFNANEADAVVWDFIKRLLLDPKTTIERYKQQQQQQTEYINDAIAHVESIDELLAELNAEREQVIILFKKRLIGEDRLDADIAVIDRQCEKLEKERMKWAEIIEEHTITEGQYQQLFAIAESIRDEIETFDSDRKIDIFDKLRLKVITAKEDDTIVLYVSILGAIPERLYIGNQCSTARRPAINTNPSCHSIVFRIAL